MYLWSRELPRQAELRRMQRHCKLTQGNDMTLHVSAEGNKGAFIQLRCLQCCAAPRLFLLSVCSFVTRADCHIGHLHQVFASVKCCRSMLCNLRQPLNQEDTRAHKVNMSLVACSSTTPKL